MEITLRDIELLLDVKLEPIKNNLSIMKADLSTVKIQVEFINTRLSKLEVSMANSELKIDKIDNKINTAISKGQLN